MVHQCGPTQQEALFARRTELSVVLDQSDRRTFLVLATGSFSRNGNQMGSRRTRTIGRDSSLAPRRRKPTHLAGERVERLPDLGNTSLRSAPASSAQRCASPSTCSARPATTKPQAVACVPSWLRRTRAPPGSTPTNATSASAQRRWRTALHSAPSADDRDLGAGVLCDLAYSATWHGHSHKGESAVRDLRSYAHKRLTSVRACGNSLPGHRTSSADHMANAWPTVPGNRQKHLETGRGSRSHEPAPRQQNRLSDGCFG